MGKLRLFHVHFASKPSTCKGKNGAVVSFDTPAKSRLVMRNFKQLIRSLSTTVAAVTLTTTEQHNKTGSRAFFLILPKAIYVSLSDRASLLRPAEVNGNICRFSKLRRAGNIPPAYSTSPNIGAVLSLYRRGSATARISFNWTFWTRLKVSQTKPSSRLNSDCSRIIANKEKILMNYICLAKQFFFSCSPPCSVILPHLAFPPHMTAVESAIRILILI